MVGFVELSHLRFAPVCGSFAFAFSCGLPIGYLGLVVLVVFVVVAAGFADWCLWRGRFAVCSELRIG